MAMSIKTIPKDFHGGVFAKVKGPLQDPLELNLVNRAGYFVLLLLVDFDHDVKLILQ